MTKRSIIAGICAILVHFSQAQVSYPELPVDWINDTHGLSNNHITVIEEDQYGFIWIGTYEGVNRYNGVDFDKFLHSPSDSTSISANQIMSMLLDRDGNMWIGTNRGLNRFRKDQKGFDRFLFGETSNTSSISAIFQDQDGFIWIGTGDGSLHKWIIETQSFKQFKNPGKSYLSAISENANGELILGYGTWSLEREGGIELFDKQNNTYIKGELLSNSKDLSVMDFIQLDSCLLIGTYNMGLIKYDLQRHSQKTYLNNPNPNQNLRVPLVYDMHMDKTGIVWVATDGGGMHWFDPNTETFRVQSNIDRNTNAAVTHILEDKNGLFWVGTVDNGVSIFNQYKSSITTYSYDNGRNTGLSAKSVLSLDIDQDGMIWIGMDRGGVNRFNPKTETFTYYLHDPDNRHSIGGDIVNSVRLAKNGDLFVGTFLNGFDRFDFSENRFKHYNGPTAVEDITYVKAFYEDANGMLWIGSRKVGLIRMDPSTGESKKFESNTPGSINHNHVTAFLEENQESVWIGSLGGLNLLDINTKTFKSWKHDPNDSTSLIGNRVMCITKDKNGGIWVGTDEGLNFYNRYDDNFRSFTTEDGLPSNTIKAIVVDDDNNLWISSNNGISRFDRKTETFKNLGIADGLNAISYGENCALKTPDGRIYFGGVGGIVSFKTDEIKHNPIPPDVVITDLLISNEVSSHDVNQDGALHISDAKSLVLDHDQNIVTFDFVAVNYTSPSKNQYAYRLKGFDDWNYVGNRNRATYTNLDPGKYTFEVKAANNDGVWNESGIALDIEVLPPWWKTTWATFLYFIALIAAAHLSRKAALARIKLSNQLKLERLDKEKEHELNQAKLRFYTNISHEFKTPLTLILGPLEKIIASKTGNTEDRQQFVLMQRNADRLLKLINQLMEFRKIDTGKSQLKTSRGDIVKFIGDIVENFSSIANQKNIKLTFASDVEHLFIWFDAEKIDKVFYNLIANALSSTEPEGSVKILLHRSRQEAVISVADTGKGISDEDLEKIFERFYQSDTSREGSGIGLALSKSLIELHDGSLSVQSKIGNGSLFTVHLPIKEYEANQTTKLDISELHMSPPQVSDEVAPSERFELDNAKDTILIAEDDLDIRTFLRTHFGSYFNVVEAANGKEGLELTNTYNPDLIISDLMMPEHNGMDFCEAVKNDEKLSHIPFIMLTAKSSEDSVVVGYELGADDYVTKPFSINLLETRVKNLIESRKSLRNRFTQGLSIDTQQLTHNEEDAQFLDGAVKIVQDNIGDHSFNVEVLLKEVGMSRSFLFKKLKSITGQAPNEFIQTIRFKMAANLILEGNYNVSQISHMVGYSTTKNFRNGFKKHFNMTPTEFFNSHQRPEEQVEDITPDPIQ